MNEQDEIEPRFLEIQKEITKRAVAINGLIRKESTQLWLARAAEKYCNEKMLYDSDTRDLIMSFAMSLMEEPAWY